MQLLFFGDREKEFFILSFYVVSLTKSRGIDLFSEGIIVEGYLKTTIGINWKHSLSFYDFIGRYFFLFLRIYGTI